MVEKEILKENFIQIKQRISDAAAKSHRDPADITLMAVTKKKNAEVVRNLLDLGIQYFGENYPDETLGKMDVFDQFRDQLRLCMIGHLQSRKIRIIAGHFDEYHSLDRLNTAMKLNDLLVKQDKSMPVFIELNVGEEESKSGWQCENGKPSDQLLRDLEIIRDLPCLAIRGIMSLPPFTEDGEENRCYFSELRQVFTILNENYGYQMFHLSMGTSFDYPVAIEEGATFIRIGTALTGPR